MVASLAEAEEMVGVFRDSPVRALYEPEGIEDKVLAEPQ
jgi:hypothetical protein